MIRKIERIIRATSMEKEKMLTTIDNPYNPYTNWDEWLAYDQVKGHCCCEYLARMCSTSDSLSDSENEKLIYDAMVRICEFDPTYRMIGRDDSPNPVSLDTVGGLNIRVPPPISRRS